MKKKDKRRWDRAFSPIKQNDKIKNKKQLTQVRRRDHPHELPVLREDRKARPREEADRPRGLRVYGEGPLSPHHQALRRSAGVRQGEGDGGERPRGECEAKRN